MKYRIVLVSFPFDDLSTSKVRPALCLSDEIGPYNHLVLAFITSQISSELLDTDLVLDASAIDFELTGLKAISTIRLHRLMTISSDMLHLELGDLPHAYRSSVDDRLRKLFNL